MIAVVHVSQLSLQSLESLPVGDADEDDEGHDDDGGEDAHH